MEKICKEKSRFIGGAILLGAAALVLFTFAVMWLWNWLMPAIFSLGVITFWQAAGLLILSKILFSGGGHAHRWHSDRQKKYWHSRFENKWKHMPDEKKEQFTKKMEEKVFGKKQEEKDSKNGNN